MYLLHINKSEYYDADKNEFFETPEKYLELEHSLISVSKWEAKWKRAFLSEKTGPKTREEVLDYIKCMTLTKNVDPTVYESITDQQIADVMKYAGDPMTATSFKNTRKGRASNSFITNEVIYWQMCQNGIPFECQKWHLNRLMTLIRVCNEKGEPPKKMTNDAILRQYANTNAKRRKPKKH